MKNLILMLALFCFIVFGSSYQSFSQITITFVPSSGTTLFSTDVDNILANYTTDQLADGFIADIDASVTDIGESAFYVNNYLLSVIDNGITSTGSTVFRNCILLKSVDLPLLTTTHLGEFQNCVSLESVSFGTGFTTPTNINFSNFIFDGVTTTDVNLILGHNVLPERDGNSWNGYQWKSITLGIEEHINNFILSPNPTADNITISFDILEAGNIGITLIDLSGTELMQLHSSFEDVHTFTKTFSIKHLPVGVYFLQISHNGNVRTEKIVKE